jgi:hypothetical protein
MGRLDAGFRTCLREELEALVPVALDHLYSVYERYTQSKRLSFSLNLLKILVFADVTRQNGILLSRVAQPGG